MSLYCTPTGLHNRRLSIPRSSLPPRVGHRFILIFLKALHAWDLCPSGSGCFDSLLLCSPCLHRGDAGEQKADERSQPCRDNAVDMKHQKSQVGDCTYVRISTADSLQTRQLLGKRAALILQFLDLAPSMDVVLLHIRPCGLGAAGLEMNSIGDKGRAATFSRAATRIQNPPSCTAPHQGSSDFPSASPPLCASVALCSMQPA